MSHLSSPPPTITFLLILFEYHIMHPNSPHFPVLYLRYTLVIIPEKKIEKSLSVEAAVSHVVPFCSIRCTGQCSVKWVIGLVRGPQLQQHHQYWTLIETPLGYPAISLSHGGLAALVLQDRPFHLSQWLIDRIGVGMGQFKVLDLRLRGSWAG